MTFLQLAKAILANSPSPLSANEIWHKAVVEGLTKELESRGATPHQSLGAQLYINVKKEESEFFSYSRNPALFGLKNKHTQVLIPQKSESKKEEESGKRGFSERDLHPLFVKFAREALSVYCKTIMHEGSTKDKKGLNRWLHPDIVGVKFAFSDFEHPRTFHLLEKLEYPRAEIYSFELKVSVESYDLKEKYFQAVSNSSWANYGYLVVFNPIGLDELKELQKLNARFGIGVITFGTTSGEFEEIITAKERNDIDFSMIDELVGKNKDFSEFIYNTTQNIGMDKKLISPALYDEVLSEYIKKHKIIRA